MAARRHFSDMMRSPYFRQHYQETPGGKFEAKVEKNILLFIKKVFRIKKY